MHKSLELLVTKNQASSMHEIIDWFVYRTSVICLLFLRTFLTSPPFTTISIALIDMFYSSSALRSHVCTKKCCSIFNHHSLAVSRVHMDLLSIVHNLDCLHVGFCLSVRLSVCLSVCQSVSVFVPALASVCVCVCLHVQSVCLHVCICVCLSVCLPWQTVTLSIYLSIYLISFYLSIYLSLCLFGCLCLFLGFSECVCVWVCLSVCVSLFLWACMYV